MTLVHLVDWYELRPTTASTAGELSPTTRREGHLKAEHHQVIKTLNSKHLLIQNPVSVLNSLDGSDIDVSSRNRPLNFQVSSAT